MKFEWRTVLGAAIFLGSVAAVYWFWSYEFAGSVMLLFSCIAYLIIFGYLFLGWHRRKKIPRPEDRLDANQEDGAGEIGFFPAASIFPAGLGLAAAFIGLGLIFGTWYFVIGAFLLFGAIAGFIVESDADAEMMDEAEEAAELAQRESGARSMVGPGELHTESEVVHGQGSAQWRPERSD